MPYPSCSGLLTGKMAKSKDTAILVPNISDFLILLNCKTPGQVVCLPNGVRNLPISVLPTLEKYNKLILWFGNSIESLGAARHFAKKLGEKRCYFIRPIDTQPLPHLCNVKDIKNILSTAQPIWHKSITSFSTLRNDIFSDLQNIDKVLLNCTFSILEIFYCNSEVYFALYSYTLLISNILRFKVSNGNAFRR